MMYTFLWNLRLWFKGLALIVMFPVVLMWKVLVDFPIEWAKEFESERQD